VEKFADRLPTVERYVVLTDAAHMPEDEPAERGRVRGLDREAVTPTFAWAIATRTRRRALLHLRHHGRAEGRALLHRSERAPRHDDGRADAFGLSTRDIVLPVVPLFHANSWSLAFAARCRGALVMPGPEARRGVDLRTPQCRAGHHDGRRADDLVRAAPASRRQQGELPHLSRVAIGGSACPRAVIEAFELRYGVKVIHAWGMTEMSPVGSLCSIKPEVDAGDKEALFDIKATQGCAPFTVEWKITDDGQAAAP
jgi:fatty-acyl-CoA synthase